MPVSLTKISGLKRDDDIADVARNGQIVNETRVDQVKATIAFNEFHPLRHLPDAMRVLKVEFPHCDRGLKLTSKTQAFSIPPSTKFSCRLPPQSTVNGGNECLTGQDGRSKSRTAKGRRFPVRNVPNDW